jgi:hypothetical protein
MTMFVKSSWPILMGAVLVLAGIGLALVTGDSDVPNDPNIGAGVLVLAGVVALASGLLVKVLDR